MAMEMAVLKRSIAMLREATAELNFTVAIVCCTFHYNAIVFKSYYKTQSTAVGLRDPDLEPDREQYMDQSRGRGQEEEEEGMVMVQLEKFVFAARFHFRTW